MKKKAIVLVTILLSFIVTFSVIYVATHVDGKDLAEVIIENDVQELMVRKYLFTNDHSLPGISKVDEFTLDEDGVDRLVQLFESENFRISDKHISMGRDEDTVEYAIYGLNSKGEQTLHIKSVTVVGLDGKIENGIVITVYAEDMKKIVKEYSFLTKDENWRENLESIFYD